MKPIRIPQLADVANEVKLSVKEAAELIGVSIPTLNRWRMEGPHSIPYVKAPGIRGRILYPLKSCHAFNALYWQKST